MATLIGQHMKTDAALDAAQFHGAVPVFEFRGYVYHIDYTGRTRGQLYYTKFEKDLKTAIHSVQMPYSNTHTLGETIDRGEGLRAKIAPMINTLPAATYAIIQCDKPSVIINKKT